MGTRRSERNSSVTFKPTREAKTSLAFRKPEEVLVDSETRQQPCYRARIGLDNAITIRSLVFKLMIV